MYARTSSLMYQCQVNLTFKLTAHQIKAMDLWSGLASEDTQASVFLFWKMRLKYLTLNYLTLHTYILHPFSLVFCTWAVLNTFSEAFAQSLEPDYCLALSLPAYGAPKACFCCADILWNTCSWSLNAERDWRSPPNLPISQSGFAGQDRNSDIGFDPALGECIVTCEHPCLVAQALSCRNQRGPKESEDVAPTTTRGHSETQQHQPGKVGCLGTSKTEERQRFLFNAPMHCQED